MPIVRIPKYCLHAPTGQAYVRVRGRMVYLGKHGTPASREAYGRAIAELAASPCNRTTSSPATAGDLTVVELVETCCQLVVGCADGDEHHLFGAYEQVAAHLRTLTNFVGDHRGSLSATLGDRRRRFLLCGLHQRQGGNLALRGSKVSVLGRRKNVRRGNSCVGRVREHRARSLPSNPFRPDRGRARPLHGPQHDLRREHCGGTDGPPVHPLAAGRAGGPRYVAEPVGRGMVRRVRGWFATGAPG